jgi:hypothetical protein
MLLGVKPFSAAELTAEANRAAADALANAAFQGAQQLPPKDKPPGVTIEDLVQAHGLLRDGKMVEARAGQRVLAASSAELASDPNAVPLSALQAEVRTLGQALQRVRRPRAAGARRCGRGLISGSCCRLGPVRMGTRS